ncbi:MAG: ATP synthase F1 subunit epsilon [Chloroflexi bacterium]|nr:ATP synthase F1 subunit epsilon [Chloroflexota bacterium]
MPIEVEIVTEERAVFNEPEADMILVPASEGQMGVLPNHAPVLTTLGFGELIVRKGSAEERFVIYGGVVDVRPDKVVVLAELAESSFEIDEQQAEEARQRAAQLLAEGLPPEQNRQAALELRRAELALRINRNIQQRTSVMRILEEREPGER